MKDSVKERQSDADNMESRPELRRALRSSPLVISIFFAGKG